MSVDRPDPRSPLARMRQREPQPPAVSMMLSAVMVMAAVAIAVVLIAPGVARAAIDPTQSIWTSDYTKGLNDPTLTYTQHVNCSGSYFIPGGQATLYPYTVPEGGTFSGRYAYRNHSSKGVTVSVNGPSTSDLNGSGISFFVTSLHVSGDYAFKMSIQCQSNNFLGDTSVSAPTLQSVSPNGATIGATFSSRVQTEQVGVDYYVQYGTQYAKYTSQSPTQSTTLSNSSSPRSMALTGLQPSTTYHYRVVMVSHVYNLGSFTNYSGADQTFTTGASIGSQRPGSSRAAPTQVSGQDRGYLRSAIQTDRAEIGAGRLALAKSQNRAVRRIATRYTRDHKLLLRSAVRLARGLHVRVPTSPAPTQVWAAQALSTLRGQVFNHWYASLEVRGHQQAIQMTTAELRSGRNAAVRHLARVALPILRAHLRLAKAALRANP